MCFLLQTVQLTLMGALTLQTLCALSRLSLQPLLSHRALFYSLSELPHCLALLLSVFSFIILRHLKQTGKYFHSEPDKCLGFLSQIWSVGHCSSRPTPDCHIIFLFCLLFAQGWTVSPYKRWTQVLTPRTSNMAFFGDRTIADVISNKALEFETLEKYFLQERHRKMPYDRRQSLEWHS